MSEVRMADRRLSVTEKNRTVVDGGDFFLDYEDGKILAYSADGCSREFVLPPLLAKEKCFKGRFWPSGAPASFAAQDGKIKIELPKGVAAIVFPICGAEKTQREEGK